MHNTPSVKLPNGQVFRAKHHVNCKTYGVVYLLLCDCGSFYVGKTKLKLWSLLQSQRRGLEQASLPEGAEVDPSSQSHHLPRFKWGDEFQAFLRRLHLSRNGKIMCLQTSSSFLLYTMVLVMYHFIYMTSLCMGSWWWYSGVSPLCSRIHGITSLQFITFCNFILLFIYFSFFFRFGAGVPGSTRHILLQASTYARSCVGYFYAGLVWLEVTVVSPGGWLLFPPLMCCLATP